MNDREPEGIRSLKESFQHAINQPRAWRDTAQNLLRAAALVERACDLDFDGRVGPTEDTARLLGPLLLLRASAIECLLKGHYVRTGRVLARKSRYVRPRRVPDHDLSALARSLNLNVPADEGVVLAALSDWIMRGRYPLQVAWDQHFFGKFGVPPAWSRRREAAYSALVKRLQAGLEG